MLSKNVDFHLQTLHSEFVFLVKMINSLLQVNSFCPQVLCSVSWVYFHWPQRTHSCQRLDHPAPERRRFFPCYGQDTKQGHSGKNHTGSTCSKGTFKVIIKARSDAVWIWIYTWKAGMLQGEPGEFQSKKLYQNVSVGCPQRVESKVWSLTKYCIKCVLRLLPGTAELWVQPVWAWVPKFRTPCMQSKRNLVMLQLLL